MKDSKEKEHRISNLKDMISNIKSEDDDAKNEIEEDSELIEYLNEDPTNYDELGIDDEFIYHPGDEKDYAINLEENPIDENFIINTPKAEDLDESDEINELSDDLGGEISENFDNIINAKIGRTPVLGVISTILGAILIAVGAFIFSTRADKVIDNVVSGENSFTVIIFVIMGLLLLIYGLYRVIGFKNPVSSMMSDIDSIEKEDNEKESDKEELEKPEEKTIPKSNIPLDKDSYKIGEFDMGDIKNKLKKPINSKPKSKPVEKNTDEIPPAREKPEEKKGMTKEEFEEMEYEQVVLDNESIDDIFAEVDDIDESIYSPKK